MAAGCVADSPAAIRGAPRIAVASGDGQSGSGGLLLASPLMVRVTDPTGATVVKGVRVVFNVEPGGPDGSAISDSIGVTDDAGIATAQLVPGAPRPGREASGDTVRVRARLAADPWRSVSFRAVTRVAPRIVGINSLNVQGGDVVQIFGPAARGNVLRVWFANVSVPAVRVDTLVRATVPPCLAPGLTDVSLEIDGGRTNALSVTVGGTRATLNLQAYQYVTLPASRLADCVSLAGAGSYLVTAQFASVPAGDGPFDKFSWQLAAPTSSGALSGRAMAARTPLRSMRASGVEREFDLVRRNIERAIAPAVGSARGTASLDRLPRPLANASPIAGSYRTFHVVAATDGSAFTEVTARLRYIGNHILAYSDTTGDRFSDTQFNALVGAMDRDLYQTAVGAFGSESDVDGNGRVIALFSPRVNALAKAEDCVLRGFVTGFFYPVDELVRNAHSNGAEIFYALMPDPDGRYSCAHTEADVVRFLQPAFIHEMQHLISFNAHVLSRGGATEETWLNEGLSAVAEELGAKVYEARYPPPLGRTSPEQIFPDSAGPYASPLLLDAYTYLYFELDHSVTAYYAGGSLEERGATWLFLRWLADQNGDALLGRLVQTSRTGSANVEAATGERFGALFGDFGLALFADSLPGLPRASAPARLRFSTRNLRRLMAREATVAGFSDAWPLTTYLLSPAGSLRSSMLPGTMMHAILPAPADGSPVRLSFMTLLGLTPLDAALGAQVAILRLPP